MLEMRLCLCGSDWKTSGKGRYIISPKGRCGASCLLRVNGFRVVSRVSWRLEAAGRPWILIDCRGW